MYPSALSKPRCSIFLAVVVSVACDSRVESDPSWSVQPQKPSTFVYLPITFSAEVTSSTMTWQVLLQQAPATTAALNLQTNGTVIFTARKAGVYEVIASLNGYTDAATVAVHDCHDILTAAERTAFGEAVSEPEAHEILRKYETFLASNTTALTLAEGLTGFKQAATGSSVDSGEATWDGASWLATTTAAAKTWRLYFPDGELLTKTGTWGGVELAVTSPSGWAFRSDFKAENFELGYARMSLGDVATIFEKAPFRAMLTRAVAFGGDSDYKHSTPTFSFERSIWDENPPRNMYSGAITTAENVVKFMAGWLCDAYPQCSVVGKVSLAGNERYYNSVPTTDLSGTDERVCPLSELRQLVESFPLRAPLRVAVPFLGLMPRVTEQEGPTPILTYY